MLNRGIWIWVRRSTQLANVANYVVDIHFGKRRVNNTSEIRTKIINFMFSIEFYKEKWSFKIKDTTDLSILLSRYCAFKFLQIAFWINCLLLHIVRIYLQFVRDSGISGICQNSSELLLFASIVYFWFTKIANFVVQSRLARRLLLQFICKKAKQGAIFER